MHLARPCVSGVLSRRVLVLTRGYATTTASAGASSSQQQQQKQDNKSTQTKRSFATFLKERADKFEHKDLVVVPAEDVRDTFIEVNGHVEGFARGLVEHRIRPGHTLVSLLPDSSVLLYTQLAAARAGITFIPFSPDIPTDKLMDKLKQYDARGLIVPDVIGNRDYIEELNDAIPELAAVTHELQPFKSRFQFPNIRMLAQYNDKDRRYHGFAHYGCVPVRGLPRDSLNKIDPFTDNQVAIILPQADHDTVDHITHSNLINTGHGILEALSANASDRIALAAPLSGIGYYIAAGCISHGAVLVQPSKSFSAEAIIKSIGRDKITILVASAKELPSILQSKELARTDVSSLKTVLIWGQGPLDAGLVSSIKEKLKAKDVFALSHVAGHTGQLTGVIHTADGKAKLLPNVEGKVDGQTLRTKGAHVLSSGEGKESAGAWLDTKVQAKADSNNSFTLSQK